MPRSVKGMNEVERGHDYWKRYTRACRAAKARGDKHLSSEDLYAVGLTG